MLISKRKLYFISDLTYLVQGWLQRSVPHSLQDSYSLPTQALRPPWARPWPVPPQYRPANGWSEASPCRSSRGSSYSHRCSRACDLDSAASLAPWCPRWWPWNHLSWPRSPGGREQEPQSRWCRRTGSWARCPGCLGSLSGSCRGAACGFAYGGRSSALGGLWGTSRSSQICTCGHNFCRWWRREQLWRSYLPLVHIIRGHHIYRTSASRASLEYSEKGYTDPN